MICAKSRSPRQRLTPTDRNDSCHRGGLEDVQYQGDGLSYLMKDLVANVSSYGFHTPWCEDAEIDHIVVLVDPKTALMAIYARHRGFD